jgi:ankyrin repeat protein
MEGDVARIRAEVEAGANPRAGDDGGDTPLHVAVQKGHVDAVKCLIDLGADVNAVNTNGNGPLWTSVLSAPHDKKAVLIKLLLQAGADPDRKNNHGRTPHEMARTIGEAMSDLFTV